MVYYSLPSGKLKNRPKRTTNLKNLPQNYDAECYTFCLAQKEEAFDSDIQQNLIYNIRSYEDVQNYLLVSSELDKHMREEID